jgi:hypothetical protein
MHLGVFGYLFIVLVMAKCNFCGQLGLQKGRGLTNHYNKCDALKAQHAQGVQNAIAVESAAAEAAAAAALAIDEAVSNPEMVHT